MLLLFLVLLILILQSLVYNGLLDSEGEGEGGMIWENGILTCILSCKKKIASLGSIQDTGCLGLVHWDDPEGWYGEGGGRRVQDWGHVYPNAHHSTVIARTWKQPRCPSAGKWIRKLWYIYTMEYTQPLKRIHLNQF